MFFEWCIFPRDRTASLSLFTGGEAEWFREERLLDFEGEVSRRPFRGVGRVWQRSGSQRVQKRFH